MEFAEIVVERYDLTVGADDFSVMVLKIET